MKKIIAFIVISLLLCGCASDKKSSLGAQISRSPKIQSITEAELESLADTEENYFILFCAGKDVTLSLIHIWTGHDADEGTSPQPCDRPVVSGSSEAVSYTHLNAEDYPLNQWKRVWLYLTDLPLPAEWTASDLREALLEQLTSPKTPIGSEQTGHGKAWAKRGKPQRTK